MSERGGSGKGRAWTQRSFAARPIGAFAARTIEPAARARGFTTLALLQEWPSIAGVALASFTAPERLIWPRRAADEEDGTRRPAQKRPAGATLVLRVDGPRAIEVQYRAQQIMERVNAHFGYRAVVELRILQAPIARTVHKIARRNLPTEVPDLPKSVKIEAPSLRRALARLQAALALKER